tara:strand:+ start:3104 stop:4105 length:1002 start_codon:yes stop_codon:yes gene_type:complete
MELTQKDTKLDADSQAKVDFLNHYDLCYYWCKENFFSDVLERIYILPKEIKFWGQLNKLDQGLKPSRAWGGRSISVRSQMEERGWRKFNKRFFFVPPYEFSGMMFEHPTSGPCLGISSSRHPVLDSGRWGHQPLIPLYRQILPEAFQYMTSEFLKNKGLDQPKTNLKIVPKPEPKTEIKPEINEEPLTAQKDNVIVISTPNKSTPNKENKMTKAALKQVEKLGKTQDLHPEQIARCKYLVSLGAKPYDVINNEWYHQCSSTPAEIKTWPALCNMLNAIHCQFEGVSEDEIQPLTASEVRATKAYLLDTGWTRYKAAKRFMHLSLENKSAMKLK